MNIDQRNTALGALGRVIGGQATLVLFDIIEKYPDRLIMLQADGEDCPSAWMRRDDGSPLKLGMDSKTYYEKINGLIGSGFLRECRIDKKTYYQVDFVLLDTFVPKEEVETPPPRPTTPIDTIQWETVDG